MSYQLKEAGFSHQYLFLPCHSSFLESNFPIGPQVNTNSCVKITDQIEGLAH